MRNSYYVVLRIKSTALIYLFRQIESSFTDEETLFRKARARMCRMGTQVV